MVFVTEAQYYMEDRLQAKTDFYIKRHAKKFDHLLLVDGEEGYGKTTWAMHLCLYYAFKRGIKFTTDNIFFYPEDIMKFASETENQIIMWDEAAYGAMSDQHQNKLQRMLIQCLIVGRKKGHLWVFLIPEVERFRDYFVRRSVGLVHIYSPDDINRGKYVYFDKQKKNKIRRAIRKRQIVNYKDYSFRGTWTKEFADKQLPQLIDLEAYEKKKDEAMITAFTSEADKNPINDKLKEVQSEVGQLAVWMKENYNMSARDFAKILDRSHPYVLDRIKDYKKSPKSLEK